MNIDPFLLPYTKLKYKWIKDLNIKPDTLNLIKRKWRIGLNSLAQENTKIYLIKNKNYPVKKWSIDINKDFARGETQVAKITFKEFNILCHHGNSN